MTLNFFFEGYTSVPHQCFPIISSKYLKDDDHFFWLKKFYKIFFQYFIFTLWKDDIFLLEPRYRKELSSKFSKSQLFTKTDNLKKILREIGIFEFASFEKIIFKRLPFDYTPYTLPVSYGFDHQNLFVKSIETVSEKLFSKIIFFCDQKINQFFSHHFIYLITRIFWLSLKEKKVSQSKVKRVISLLENVLNSSFVIEKEEQKVVVRHSLIKIKEMKINNLPLPVNSYLTRLSVRNLQENKKNKSWEIQLFCKLIILRVCFYNC